MKARESALACALLCAACTGPDGRAMTAEDQGRPPSGTTHPVSVDRQGRDLRHTGPGVPFDLQGLIDRELAAGSKRIIVPPGRYRVTPRKRQHLLLSGLDGVEIVAADVEMICTETTRALTVHKCRDLTLRGLTIDYDPLPFTQGRIVRMSEDGLAHEIELFEGYPPAAAVGASKYEIFRPEARALRFGSYYGFTVEKVSPRRIRVTKPAHYRRKRPERVGDIIAIGASHAPGGQIPHAVYCEHTANVTLEDVSLYASNCFGFFESNCKATTYRRCKVDRRPPEADLKERADARIRSLNADAYHSKHASVGPSYIECSARFQGDDCVAINGDYHMVTAAKGNALRVLAKRAMNIAPGDPVELLTYEGRRLPDAKALAVEPDGTVAADEKAFIGRQRMHAPFKRNEHGFLTKAFRVTLDREVELPRGSLICSANRVGNGFKVIGGDFGFNRSREILVKASRGEIRGNRLEGCWMEAIKGAPEYWWLEAGSSDDLVISGNTITNCLGRAIAVCANGGPGKVAPAGAHRNIEIVNNTIRNVPSPAIRVTSTAGLILRGNSVSPLPTGDAGDAVELVNCVEVRK